MGYVGGETVPAPTLNAVTLEAKQAKRLYDQCLQIIELMLSLGLVHGDFSAYNILYWEGAITVIDFPQVVEPESNPNAYFIFTRDVQRICEYFATQGIKSEHAALSRALWLKYGHSVAPPVLNEGEVVEEDDEEDTV
jgi:RIO kinase 1